MCVCVITAVRNICVCGGRRSWLDFGNSEELLLDFSGVDFRVLTKFSLEV